MRLFFFLFGLVAFGYHHQDIVFESTKAMAGGGGGQGANEIPLLGLLVVLLQQQDPGRQFGMGPCRAPVIFLLVEPSHKVRFAPSQDIVAGAIPRAATVAGQKA